MDKHFGLEKLQEAHLEENTQTGILVNPIILVAMRTMPILQILQLVILALGMISQILAMVHLLIHIILKAIW